MNMLSWLTRKSGPTIDEIPQGHNAGWFASMASFVRSAKPSWTEDGRRLHNYHANRSKARRQAAVSRRRNRGRHPQSAKAA